VPWTRKAPAPQTRDDANDILPQRNESWDTSQGVDSTPCDGPKRNYLPLIVSAMLCGTGS
jgi:hypothetical protein